MRETYDVIVVGGGIMGCSAAWQLERKQKRVLVIERRDVASGAAGARAARLLHGSRTRGRRYRTVSDHRQADCRVDCGRQAVL